MLQEPYNKNGIQTVDKAELKYFPNKGAYDQSMYQLWWNDQPKSESDSGDTLVQTEKDYDNIHPMFIKSHVNINPDSNSKNVAHFKWAHEKENVWILNRFLIKGYRECSLFMPRRIVDLSSRTRFQEFLSRMKNMSLVYFRAQMPMN
jgi:hypothetical protein